MNKATTILMTFLIAISAPTYAEKKMDKYVRRFKALINTADRIVVRDGGFVAPQLKC